MTIFQNGLHQTQVGWKLMLLSALMLARAAEAKPYPNYGFYDPYPPSGDQVRERRRKNKFTCTREKILKR